jgi:hypothetical protein
MNTNFIHPFESPETLLQNLNEFKNTNLNGQTPYDVIKDYHLRFKNIPTYQITLRKGMRCTGLAGQ